MGVGVARGVCHSFSGSWHRHTHHTQPLGRAFSSVARQREGFDILDFFRRLVVDWRDCCGWWPAASSPAGLWWRASRNRPVPGHVESSTPGPPASGCSVPACFRARTGGGSGCVGWARSGSEVQNRRKVAIFLLFDVFVLGTFALILSFFTFLLLSQHARTAIIAAHTGKSSVMAGGLIPTRSVETASYTLSTPPFPARPLTLRIRPHHSRTHCPLQNTEDTTLRPDRPIVSGQLSPSIIPAQLHEHPPIVLAFHTPHHGRLRSAPRPSPAQGPRGLGRPLERPVQGVVSLPFPPLSSPPVHALTRKTGST